MASSHFSELIMRLWMKLSLSKPVFDATQLEALHGLIGNNLPQWASKLKVIKDEDCRNGQLVGLDGNLAEAVNLVAPVKRGLGSAILKGGYKGLSFYLDSGSSTLPPELNRISVEIQISTVEKMAASRWAFDFFGEAASRLPLRYASCRTSEEFESKNMISNAGITRAIGVLLADYLPGIYWLNYFGEPYRKLIGLDRLLSAPAYHVRELSKGVMLALDELPTAWSSKQYKANEQSVIKHLGEKYFFDRNDPERARIAPVFSKDDA